MKRLSLILFSVILISAFQSCNDENTDKNNDDITVKDTIDNDDNKTVSDAVLINIPVKISEESKRYEIDTDLIAVEVFNAKSHIIRSGFKPFFVPIRKFLFEFQTTINCSWMFYFESPWR